MLRSLLIGLVAGQRAMTPLAVVTDAARRGNLALDVPGFALLSNALVGSFAALLAAGEMAGDKMASAPDRIILPGLIGRGITAALAGAALAPARQRKTAAFVATITAIASSHIGLALRLRAMRRFGQTSSGTVEDAIVLTSGCAVANLGRSPYTRHEP